MTPANGRIHTSARLAGAIAALGLMLAVLACQAVQGQPTAAPTAADTLPATERPPPNTRTPQPAVEASATPAADDPRLGAVQRVAAGGYSFRAVTGYDLQEDGNSFTLLPPGADLGFGPAIFMTGGPNTGQATFSSLRGSVTRSMNFVVTSASRSVEVGGLPATEGDFNGVADGTRLAGRVVVALLNDNQQIFTTP